MNSHLGHLQINIDEKNISFYKDLMTFLGWKILHEAEDIAGFGNEDKATIWFIKRLKEVENEHDGVGMNHIAFGVSSTEEVNKVVEYLKEKGIEALFETPRHRPEFAGETGTYYQVMFESPDKILFEVVFAKFS